MNKAGISFEEMKKDLLKDSEFKTEYDKLTLRYETIKQTITVRKEQNIRQPRINKKESIT